MKNIIERQTRRQRNIFWKIKFKNYTIEMEKAKKAKGCTQGSVLNKQTLLKAVRAKPQFIYNNRGKANNLIQLNIKNSDRTNVTEEKIRWRRKLL